MSGALHIWRAESAHIYNYICRHETSAVLMDDALAEAAGRGDITGRVFVVWEGEEGEMQYGKHFNVTPARPVVVELVA